MTCEMSERDVTHADTIWRMWHQNGPPQLIYDLILCETSYYYVLLKERLNVHQDNVATPRLKKSQNVKLKLRVVVSYSLSF